MNAKLKSFLYSIAVFLFVSALIKLGWFLGFYLPDHPEYKPYVFGVFGILLFCAVWFNFYTWVKNNE